MAKTRLGLLASSLVLASGASAQIPETYDVVDLGVVTPRSVASAANAISDAFHVVGSYEPSPGRSHAALWMRDASGTWQLTDLGALLPSGSSSEAVDVNDHGQVVGWIELRPGSSRQGVRWMRTSGGVWKARYGQLGWSVAAINAEGETLFDAGTGPLPVLTIETWDRFRGGFPGVPLRLTAVRPADLNDAGDVAGTAIGRSGTHAVFQAAADRSRVVHKLKGRYGGHSIADAVNAAGHVAGTAGGRATVWRNVGSAAAPRFAAVDLHDAAWSASDATGINSGSVVVGSFELGGARRGFVHDLVDDERATLATRLGYAVVDPVEPRDVNDAGAIVGRGLVGAKSRAFVLLPRVDYALVELGTKPVAINDRGVVVGGKAPPYAGSGRNQGTWVWDRGALTQIAGAPTQPYDIADDGRIAGDVVVGTAGGGAGFWARDAAGVWQGTFVGGGAVAAYGVSGANRVFGSSYQVGLIWLAEFAPGQTTVPIERTIRTAIAIAPDGFQAIDGNASEIVVGACLRDTGQRYRSHACTWSRRYGTEFLANAGLSTYIESECLDVNGRGQVVGVQTEMLTRPNGQPVTARTAFRFDRSAPGASGRTVVLPGLSGLLWANAQANAIDSRGRVVGHASDRDGENRAVLWRADGSIIDLNGLLTPADRAAYTLVDAVGINDRGEIVGLADKTGQVDDVGYLLRLP